MTDRREELFDTQPVRTEDLKRGNESMRPASEIRKAREERWGKMKAGRRGIMPIVISKDRPPFVPSPGHQLRRGSHEARLSARWLRNYASRARVPLSPRVTHRLQQICYGKRAFRYRDWTAIMKWIQLKKDEAKMRKSVPLRISIGLGGVTLGRQR
jgi:hypothetical protein